MTATGQMMYRLGMPGPDIGLHELFEAQAQRTPAAPAVIADDVVLTFSELDLQANRLAHYLLRQGVTAESRVAVRMGRSAPLVVALLGVLKAGAVYTPVDPTYPPERLALMLNDPGLALLLTDAPVASDMVPSAVRAMQYSAAVIAEEPAAKPPVGVTARNLAYVFYTSGSTGRPKGVMVTHQAICNHTLWFQERFQLNAGDKLLHKTPIGFDPSVTEFMAPLVAGAQLVLAADYAHRDPGYLVETVIEKEITVLQVVPTLLRLLIDQRRLRECRSLRLLISGGEALPSELVSRLRALLPAQVHNFYGPTETAIDVTCLNVAEAQGQAIVPIGRPIANTSIKVLDANMRPVPDGELGELYIGGIPLARGYLGRPDLTAERFVPDPVVASGELADAAGAPVTAGRRLYRTGDLGRYLPGGVLEFAGRTDQQLKVRGVRVEPGEIEAVLREHPAVSEAAVTARMGPADDVRLVAYVVARTPPNGGQGPDPDLRASVRDHLTARLPAYLVPSSVTVLAGLPRTPAGKLDRRRLPATTAETERATEFAVPRTALEQEIAGTFARMLGLDRIGINDRLFDLGADSLTVARLGTQVKNTYDVQLPLFLLFSVPTVAGVAEAVQSYALYGEEHAVTRSTSLARAEAELEPGIVPDWRNE